MAAATMAKATSPERQALAAAIAALPTHDAAVEALRAAEGEARSKWSAADHAVEALERQAIAYDRIQNPPRSRPSGTVLPAPVVPPLASLPFDMAQELRAARADRADARKALDDIQDDIKAMDYRRDNLVKARTAAALEVLATSPSVRSLPERLIEAQRNAASLGQQLFWLVDRKIIPTTRVNPDPKSRALTRFINAGWELPEVEGSRPLWEALDELLTDPEAFIP